MANNKDNNIKLHGIVTKFFNNVKAKFTKVEIEYKAADTKIEGEYKVADAAILVSAKADATAKDAALKTAIETEYKAADAKIVDDQKKVDADQDAEIAKKADKSTVDAIIETTTRSFTTSGSGNKSVTLAGWIPKRAFITAVNYGISGNEDGQPYRQQQFSDTNFGYAFSNRAYLTCTLSDTNITKGGDTSNNSNLICSFIVEYEKEQVS